MHGPGVVMDVITTTEGRSKPYKIQFDNGEVHCYSKSPALKLKGINEEPAPPDTSDDDKVNLQQICSSHALFRKHSKSQLGKLLPKLQRSILRPGDTLFNAGDAGTCRYVVLSGELACISPVGGLEVKSLQSGKSLRTFILLCPPFQKTGSRLRS